MSWLTFFSHLYSVKTLDTRFVNSPPSDSRGDAAKGATNDERGRKRPVNDIQPPKWATLEYSVYFLSVFFSVAMMFKTVYDVSKRMSLHQHLRSVVNVLRMNSKFESILGCSHKASPKNNCSGPKLSSLKAGF